MQNLLSYLIENLSFIFDRITWLSILDLVIVTLIFFGLLILLRDTQAVVLLRGVLVLVVLGSLLSSMEALPAFSWLVRTTLPGTPITTERGGTTVLGVTTALAATRHSSPITEPSKTVLLMPMMQLSPMVAPLITAPWPTVVSLPINVG